MAFNVGDIVKKTGGHTQKYKVVEVKPAANYSCQYEPNTAPDVFFTFKEAELVLV